VNGYSTCINATLLGVRRLGRSVNGNPIMVVDLDVGSYRTETDAIFAYDLQNWVGRTGPVTVRLNENRNCVVNMQEGHHPDLGVALRPPVA
jgi:hypothetical protein